MIRWEELTFILIIVCFVSFALALFFGVVMVNQSNAFYSELQDLPKLTDTPQKALIWKNVLAKYRMGWYSPNLVGFYFAIISVVSGCLSLAIIRWKIR